MTGHKLLSGLFEARRLSVGVVEQFLEASGERRRETVAPGGIQQSHVDHVELTRYPTTETNRNRLRARMYYQHFLGVDVLELAARVSDAAAVTAKYKVPTMEASECVVCHPPFWFRP